MSDSSLKLWLFFPQRLVQEPLIYQLGHEFKVSTNIRQATVHDDVGLVCLEISGDHDEMDRGIEWLESKGVKVEPVEVNVVDS